MGYDMHMVERPKELPPDYVPQDEDDPGYFRMVISGMAVMRELMDEAGVLDTDAEHPDFEEVWPPEGVDAERADEILEHLENGEPLDPPPTSQELEICSRAKAAMESLLGTRSAEADKVPVFKFGSNDGWWVLPAECTFIAAALSTAVTQRGDVFVGRLSEMDLSRTEILEWIQSWANYNRVAALHGGYRVL